MVSISEFVVFMVIIGIVVMMFGVLGYMNTWGIYEHLD